MSVGGLVCLACQMPHFPGPADPAAVTLTALAIAEELTVPVVKGALCSSHRKELALLQRAMTAEEVRPS